MHRSLLPTCLFIDAVALMGPAPVIASEFLSLENAQQAAFAQADRFEELTLNLSNAQRQQIARLAGPQPGHGNLRVFRAWQGNQSKGYFLVDEVIGRQDLITYSLAIDAQGTLGPLEILTYRESHGREVRNTAWRAQFANKHSLSEVRFGTDIKNIAGATLSCEHLTQGARWLVALWQTALKPLP